MVAFVLMATVSASSFSSVGRCVEDSVRNETCSQAFARGVPCAQLYTTWRCCVRCDPCGIDGRLCKDEPASASASASWVSPRCQCDQVVVTGACSTRGCAKPDALGVFTKQPAWRTADGRFVYVKEREQPGPGQGLHPDAFYHASFDDSSGANMSTAPGVYIYHRSGRWVIGPRATLDDDVYARSSVADAPCPTQAGGWAVWWGGGVSPLSMRTSYSTGLAFYTSTPRGWLKPVRYPLSIACWAKPPAPPPPPPRPPPPPPPPPPMPPPPLRLVPGPYTGRLEVFHSKVGTLIANRLVNRLPGASTSIVRAWGTVCDDGFDRSDATVACRQLGLGRALRFWRVSLDDDDDDDVSDGHERLLTPPAVGPVWLENMRCGGEEDALVECGYIGWGNTDCSHSEDIHLLCAPPPRRPPPLPAATAPVATRSQTGADLLFSSLLAPGGFHAPTATGTSPVGSLGFEMIELLAVPLLLVVLLACALCLLCTFMVARAGSAQAAPRAVHVTLQAPPAMALGGAEQSSEQQREAQQQLAAALTRALEEGK